MRWLNDSKYIYKYNKKTTTYFTIRKKSFCKVRKQNTQNREIHICLMHNFSNY